MQIDPGQPIMFDSESPPGRGTGYWQMDPGRPDDSISMPNDAQRPKVVSLCIFGLVFGVMALGIGDMLLR